MNLWFRWTLLEPQPFLCIPDRTPGFSSPGLSDKSYITILPIIPWESKTGSQQEKEGANLHNAHKLLFKWRTITWVCLDGGNSRLPHCYQMHQSAQMRVQTPAFHWTRPSHSEETKPTWTQLPQRKQNNDVHHCFFFNGLPQIKSVPVSLYSF